jgi:hypothetical protein
MKSNLVVCKHNTAGSVPPEAEPGELRCVCNRLIFVRRGEAVEIKCSKCKRLIVIQTAGIKRVEVV